jgi:hypothetical protein
MKLYIFKSLASSQLRAFAGDIKGSKLPEQFRPWHVVGVVAPERSPPHNLSRVEIEKAIEVRGFQLWRMKQKASAERPDI